MRAFRNLLIVAALVLISITVYRGTNGSASAGPTYRTDAVELGEIVSTVMASGTVSAVTTVQVGTQISGFISTLEVDFNDRVKKDQVIAEIDRSIVEADRRKARASETSARASVARAEAVLFEANRKLDRARSMSGRGLAAAGEIEPLETSVKLATADLAVARGRLEESTAARETTDLRVTQTVIRSPIDGIVISRAVDVGQTVQASFSAPTLFTIANNLTAMQVKALIDEADVGRVREGLPARFSVDSYPGREFLGKVQQVRNSPTVSSGVVTYDAILTVDNQELLLKPGMTANVVIELDRKADIVKVPSSALRYAPKPGEAIATPTGTERRRFRRVEGEERGDTGEVGAGDRRAWRRRDGEGGQDSTEVGSGERRGRRRREGEGRSETAEIAAEPPPTDDETANDDDAGAGTGVPGSPRIGKLSNRRPALAHKRTVYRLKDGRPEPVTIVTGLEDMKSVEMVRGGLKPGDLVITDRIDSKKTGSMADLMMPRGPGRGR